VKYCRFYDYSNADSWWSKLKLFTDVGWQLHSITIVDLATSKIMVIMQGNDSVFKLSDSETNWGVKYSW